MDLKNEKVARKLEHCSEICRLQNAIDRHPSVRCLMTETKGGGMKTSWE